MSALCTSITDDDVGFWPYSVGALVKMAAFLRTLHWPASGADLDVGGVSYVEPLILCELWAGERLCFEQAIPRGRRPGRPISVSAVPPGPGIDIWRFRRYLGEMLRALGALPGGLVRFMPCNIGAIVWEKSGHGLTSRPRETSRVSFLDELLVLFGYPPRSGGALLGGSLLLRYCAASFACEIPTWKLPVGGELLVFLLSMRLGVVPCVLSLHLVLRVTWVLSGIGSRPSGRGYKRVRLSRKNPACEVFRGQGIDQPRPRVWKRLRTGRSLLREDDDAGGRYLHGHLPFGVRVQDRVGVGSQPLRLHGPMPPGLHGF